MNTSTEHTGRRTRGKVRCAVLGHRWEREDRPDDTVLLTCGRCGRAVVFDGESGVWPRQSGFFDYLGAGEFGGDFGGYDG